MLPSPFLSMIALALAGQQSLQETPDSGKVVSVSKPWNSSSGLRNCKEHPEECPTPSIPDLRKMRRFNPSGTFGPRLQEDAFGLQLGIRDSGSNSGQWVVGIGGARDQSQNRHDSVHVTSTDRSLAARIGREFWHDGPGRLVLVGSTVLQGAWRWNEKTFDSTIHVLRTNGSPFWSAYVEEHRSRTFTKREMSVDLLLGAGIRMPSSSGAFALFAGVEGGPGWLTSSDQSEDVAFDDLVLVRPTWRLGMDWCF